MRNTQVIDLIAGLREYNLNVDVYDPWIDVAEAKREYDLDCWPEAPGEGVYDAIVVAVGHREFVAMGPDMIRAFGKPKAIIYDIKGILPRGSAEGRL